MDNGACNTCFNCSSDEKYQKEITTSNTFVAKWVQNIVYSRSVAND